MGKPKVGSKTYPWEEMDRVVCDSSSYYDEGDVQYISVRPYLVSGAYKMMVSDRKIRNDNDAKHATEREVFCKDWHLVGERKPKEPSKPLISKEMKLKIQKQYKAPLFTAIVLFVLLLIGMWFVGNYNSLVSASNGVDNRWAKVEVQYQRRLDLITNYANVAKGAQIQEQKVFGDIAKARSQYNNATSTDDKVAAASQIETNVALIPRLQEAYPELKSNVTLNNLAAEIAGTENGIAVVRNEYNDSVTNYNTHITRFPKNLFANLYGYDKRTLFSGTKAAAQAPVVNLQ